MLVATIALAVALTGVLWFAWPFLRIRAREAWYRLRKEKGPHRAVALTRAEQEIGARLAVPYGYQAINRRRQHRKRIRKTYQLSGKQMRRLELAVRAGNDVEIVRANGRGLVRVGPRVHPKYEAVAVA